MASITTASADPVALREFEKVVEMFTNELPATERIAFSQARSISAVYEEVYLIQQTQEKSKAFKYMNRLKPFIDGLDKYSRVIDIFTNVKPELVAFLWGPLKFLLVVSKAHIEALDKLLNAFRSVGESLPRFHLLGSTFSHRREIQVVLVQIYSDILEFYSETLAFFRMKSWKRLFSTMWSSFDEQFTEILERLNRHTELVDKEAAAVHFSEASASHELVRKGVDESRRNRIRQWLRPIDDEITFRKCERIIRDYDCNAEWLFDNKMFTEWKEGHHQPVLWLTGKPGSGKTVGSFQILEHLRTCMGKSREYISGIFLSYRDKKDLSLAAVLRTLIQKLLDSEDSLFEPFLLQFHNLSDSTPLVSELEQCIESLLRSSLDQPRYLIVDGLDEIDEEGERRNLIQHLLRLPSIGNIKILLSGRPTSGISEFIRDYPELRLHRYNSGTIQQFTNTVCSRLIQKFGLEIEESTSICDRVAEKADGMFLYAYLVAQNLLGQATIKQLRAASDELPEGLDEVYERILISIDQHATAREVIEWLCCAKRPPRIAELRRIIPLSDSDTLFSRDNMLPETLGIESIRGSIVEIESGFVNFVHFTAREYILSPNGSRRRREYGPLSKLHLKMAERCMIYFSFSCFNDKQGENAIIQHITNGNYAWLDYSEKYWLDHVKGAAKALDSVSGPRLAKLILRHFEKWKEDGPLPMPVGGFDFGLGGYKIYSETVYAFLRRCALLKSQGSRSNKMNDAIRFSPFCERVWRAMDLMVTAPKKLAVDITSLSKMYGTELYRCRFPHCGETFAADNIRRQHHKMHQYNRPFRCKKANCDYAVFGFVTRAALELHTKEHDNVSLLTEFQAMQVGPAIEAEIQKPSKGQLLREAIKKDDIKLVEKLVEGSDPHTFGPGSGFSTETPLSFAADCGSVETVRILLNKGADPNYKPQGSQLTVYSPRYFQPLHHAAQKGYTEVASLLLESGADVEAEKTTPYRSIERGETPLEMASVAGHLEMVELLQEWGAAIRNDGPLTTLQIVARDCNSIPVLRYLLESEALWSTDQGIQPAANFLLSTILKQRWNDTEKKIQLVDSILRSGYPALSLLDPKENESFLISTFRRELDPFIATRLCMIMLQHCPDVISLSKDKYLHAERRSSRSAIFKQAEGKLAPTILDYALAEIPIASSTKHKKLRAPLREFVEALMDAGAFCQDGYKWGILFKNNVKWQWILEEWECTWEEMYARYQPQRQKAMYEWMDQERMRTVEEAEKVGVVKIEDDGEKEESRDGYDSDDTLWYRG
ncbi:hypothetical protein BJ508DRAFT_367261 [Ascobolus immersus RN42]|uniref:C2H2-type domain-containing protein n=1 Tax=Ascobolus immersus RN42 TaxID=1160509 RepID=A0A3N4HRZ0_ASCIM|nr:hypothetical protein BJ508DRAFT_367261 [Ascobolus immersus RN42]